MVDDVSAPDDGGERVGRVRVLVVHGEGDVVGQDAGLRDGAAVFLAGRCVRVTRLLSFYGPCGVFRTLPRLLQLQRCR